MWRDKKNVCPMVKWKDTVMRYDPSLSLVKEKQNRRDVVPSNLKNLVVFNLKKL